MWTFIFARAFSICMVPPSLYNDNPVRFFQIPFSLKCINLRETQLKADFDMFGGSLKAL